MNKGILVAIIVLVAAVSSAATVGVMKYVETHKGGGPIVIVTDKRCEECDPVRLETSLKRTFPNEQFEVVDYGDRRGKKLFKSEDLKTLPAVLLPKRLEASPEYQKIGKYVVPGAEYAVLKTGGTFDPEAEICDNEIDDNGDGMVDCEDPTCKTDWRCMEKREKPAVDVFVMSHCPYGTQIVKGVLPVWDLLGDKVDLNIRFVDYAMHGKKEVDEQLRQYCIQKQDKKVYQKYLNCFLKEGKTDDTCIKEAKVNSAALNNCLKEADQEFGVTAAFNDKTKWNGRFPPFPVDAEMAKKFGVKGSPTLVVNNVVVKAGRSPKAILDAVCNAFSEVPEECKKELESTNPSPGFGIKKGEGGGDASCGS